MEKKQRITHLLEILPRMIVKHKYGKQIIISDPSSKLQLIKPNNHYSKLHITKKLLLPENKISRKNLATWISELIKALESRESPHLIDENLSVIYNQAALIHSFIGDHASSIKLCYAQINFALKCANKNNDAIKFLIQPLINLGRINRLLGFYKNALAIFDLLNQLSNGTLDKLNSNQLNAANLLNSLKNNPDHAMLIETCRHLEPIKTHLLTNNHNKILQITDLIYKHSNLLLRALAYESAIIVYLNFNQVNSALELIDEAKVKLPIEFENIFLYRQAEIFINTNKPRGRALFSTLLELINFDENKHQSPQLLNFAIELAYKIKITGSRSLTLKAFDNALAFARYLNDEISTIICLKEINKLKPSIATRHEMLFLIDNCDYQIIQKEFLTAKNPKKLAHINSNLSTLKETLISISS